MTTQLFDIIRDRLVKQDWVQTTREVTIEDIIVKLEAMVTKLRWRKSTIDTGTYIRVNLVTNTKAYNEIFGEYLGKINQRPTNFTRTSVVTVLSKDMVRVQFTAVTVEEATQLYWILSFISMLEKETKQRIIY